MSDIMSETQPGPIRIKLITQLEGSYLDAAGKKRLAEQLGPGAVNIIQKYVQVRGTCGVCSVRRRGVLVGRVGAGSSSQARVSVRTYDLSAELASLCVPAVRANSQSKRHHGCQFRQIHNKGS